jgi:hypothetical protein
VAKTPKTAARVRTVAFPRWLLPLIEFHLRDYSGQTADGAVFVGPVREADGSEDPILAPARPVSSRLPASHQVQERWSYGPVTGFSRAGLGTSVLVKGRLVPFRNIQPSAALRVALQAPVPEDGERLGGDSGWPFDNLRARRSFRARWRHALGMTLNVRFLSWSPSWL